MEITYLEHSGFMVETEHHILIFDYYKDPAGMVALKLDTKKSIEVFCSHNHGDHFNPAVAQWKGVTTYYLSYDIVEERGLAGIDPKRVQKLAPYETCQQGQVIVKSYGSTDAGISFFVEVDGWKVFHAGDLNWWHWKGDTPENLQQAAVDFKRELQYLQGERFDIAFFPVDSRLEEYRTLGVEAFCRATHPDQIVAMHAFGPVWQPPEPFIIEGISIPVWVPARAGENFTVLRGAAKI